MLLTTVCSGFAVRGGVGGGEIDQVSVGVVDEIDGEFETGDDEDDIAIDLMIVSVVGSRRSASNGCPRSLWGSKVVGRNPRCRRL